MRWPLRFLFWLDRAVNVLLGGVYSETLSARAWRMDVKDHPYWGWTARAIDLLFFWQPDHCRKQWEYEQAHPLQGVMFPVDKVLHFLAGVAIAAVAYPLGLAVSMLAVFVLAILKELRDSMGYGTSDALDAAATICGGFALLLWFDIAARYLA
jgi:hypothetical protein